MFTGIVSTIGTVESVRQEGDLRLRIACPYDPATIAIGASIACSGVCLTVVERGGEPGDAWFEVDVSAETIARTAAHRWQEGARLNLERSLKMGDELGGHIVTGHVDVVGEVAKVAQTGDSTVLTIAAPTDMAPYVAEKGSITVDGASLTVNEVDDSPGNAVHFALNIIPHTGEVTTLGALAEGDPVNLEIDVLARYLQRMVALRS